MRGLEGEVHVCRLNLAPTPDDLAGQCWPLLDGEEQGRATRIRHWETRRNFAMVRSALRFLLGRYLSRDPRSIQFVQGEKGKPRLAGTEPDRGLVFNVSHSGECGLIALARDTALGADVERWRDMANQEGIAERCFSIGELAYWRALPLERKQQAFFSLWCFKEAFAKATGEGITLGLESCVVDLSAQPRLVSIPNQCGSPDAWRLVGIIAGKGHSGGICYRGDERKLHLVDDAELVNSLFSFSN